MGWRWGNTSSSTSTKDCAFALDRCLMASTSSRSENRSVIKEIHSLVGRGRSTKRSHAGAPLRMRNTSGQHLVWLHIRNSQAARNSQSMWASSDVLIPASLRQPPQSICQGWVCRSRRALTANDRQHSRVRRFVVERNGPCENLDAKSQFARPQPQLDRPQLTSIVTIANEKTSAFLL